MSSKFSFQGHAYNRVFTYIENGIHKEFTVPGGAALLAKLLGVQAAPLDDAYRKEHAELQLFTNPKSKKSYYAISRRLGYSAGETSFSTTGLAENVLVWDEGFGNITLPEGNMPVLWASNKVLPNEELFVKIAPHTFLFLDASVLRSAGAMISRQISWERTASELIWQLKNNRAISYLLKAKELLIAFDEDAAISICQDEQSGLKATLTLAHGGGEGTLRRKLYGDHDDAFILMTAELSRQFPAPVGSRRVLRQAEALLTAGYTIEALQSSDFPETLSLDETKNTYEIPIGKDTTDLDAWCITNSATNKRIFDIAYDYVMEGAAIIEGLPRLTFGALTTVDRWEIEAFQNIRNLISGYHKSSSVKPLSIAVFGTPGSGKSFGVKQIADYVLPDKVKKLEFNVSQFTGFSDLGAAFQKVRDVILGGKLPLVFFDEFDSDRDGHLLGWIKSFLMPMQDGKFKDDSGEHPLGKCILVFAGGTAASFEEFSKPMLSPNPVEVQAFKNVKGPDFISRLKGTINILGQNPTNENDHNYILRRALLLRSFCEKNFKIRNDEIAPVSRNIVWAMLLVPQYKHGARSMEAILDMSRLEGNVWEPVSLPFYSQLALHVDADAFIRLVLREVILNSYNEQLAKAIHEDFYTKSVEAGDADRLNVVPWADLAEKDSNREQAASYDQKLCAIGYSYDSGDTPFPSVENFTKEETIILAYNEHQRWMEEKIRKGYTYAPLSYGMELAQKSLSKGEWDALSEKAKENLAIKMMREDMKNHLLIPFEQLPEKEKQKDINTADNMIPLLKSIGLRVYKTI